MVLYLGRSLFAPPCLPDRLVLVWNMALCVPMVVQTNVAACAFLSEHVVARSCHIVSPSGLPFRLAQKTPSAGSFARLLCPATIASTDRDAFIPSCRRLSEEPVRTFWEQPAQRIENVPHPMMQEGTFEIQRCLSFLWRSVPASHRPPKMDEAHGQS